MTPIFVFILIKSLRNDLFALFSESHDFLTDWTCSACILFMKIVEDSHSSSTITIISDSFGEHWNKCGFASIYVPYYSYFDEFLGSLCFLSSFHLISDQNLIYKKCKIVQSSLSNYKPYQIFFPSNLRIPNNKSYLK